MATLYLDRRDTALKLDGTTLTIYVDGVHQTTVPLHMLERVVMYSAVEIQSSLLARLADAGIGVLAFGGRNAGKVAIVQGSAHNDGARRIGQYRRYDDASWRRQWSRRLVLGKLKGQARLLHLALWERPDLRHPLREGSIRLLDEETNDLKMRSTYGLSEEYRNKGMVTKDDPVITAAFAGAAIRIDDMRADDRIRFKEATNREGLVSQLFARL